MSNIPHEPDHASIEDQLADLHRQNFLMGEQLRKAIGTIAELYSENQRLKEPANDTTQPKNITQPEQSACAAE